MGTGDRGAKKAPHTSFSPVTSTNVRISLQNFLTFSFDFLPHWYKVSRRDLVPPPSTELGPRPPLKNNDFH